MQKGVKYEWIAKYEKGFQEFEARLTLVIVLVMLDGPEGYVMYECNMVE